MSENRLNDLRQRWEAEPASRVFLQLADEYRRLGRLREAVEVLATGLERSPNHLSAQVALGRCQLELGDFAESGRLLESVIQRDPTQLVANKLLVESYRGQGDRLRAEAQLDRYRLLNGGDPEIEDLAAKVAELSVQAEAGAPDAKLADASAEPEATPSSVLEELRQESSASAPPAPAPATDEPFADLFDLFAPNRAEAAKASTSEGDLFDLGLEGPASELTPAPPAPQPEPTPNQAEQSSSSEAEGDIFDLGLPKTASSAGELDLFSPPVESTDAEPTSASQELEPTETELEGLAVEEPQEEEAEEVPAAAAVPEEPPPFELSQTEEPAKPEQIGEREESPEERRPTTDQGDAGTPEDAEAASSPSEEPATATLGYLFLEQGHLDQAKETFERVLAREADNAKALAGLREVKARETGASPLTAVELLQGAQEISSLSDRRAFVLRRYLDRIRHRS